MHASCLGSPCGFAEQIYLSVDGQKPCFLQSRLTTTSSSSAISHHNCHDEDQKEDYVAVEEEHDNLMISATFRYP